MPPLAPPGNFILVTGDDEASAWLRSGNEHVMSMVTDVVDDIAEHAADELRSLAPGRIGAELVDVAHAYMSEPGIVEAVAGVEPEITPDTFTRGLGSDPADFPVFVDQGTGEFGQYRRPIEVIPGNVMVIPFPEGKVFTPKIKGQEAQQFSERAWENTIFWTPVRLFSASLPSGGT